MKWHKSIAKMMQTYAINFGVDPATLLSMPTYVESSTFYPTSLVPNAMEEHNDTKENM